MKSRKKKHRLVQNAAKYNLTPEAAEVALKHINAWRDEWIAMEDNVEVCLPYDDPDHSLGPFNSDTGFRDDVVDFFHSAMWFHDAWYLK